MIIAQAQGAYVPCLPCAGSVKARKYLNILTDRETLYNHLRVLVDPQVFCCISIAADNRGVGSSFGLAERGRGAGPESLHCAS